MTVPPPTTLHSFFDPTLRTVKKNNTTHNIQEAFEAVEQQGNSENEAPNPAGISNGPAKTIVKKQWAKRGRRPRGQLTLDAGTPEANPSPSNAQAHPQAAEEEDECKPTAQKLSDPFDDGEHDAKRQRLSPAVEENSAPSQVQQALRMDKETEEAARAASSNFATAQATSESSREQEALVLHDVESKAMVDRSTRSGNATSQGSPHSLQPTTPTSAGSGEMHREQGALLESNQDQKKTLRLNGKGRFASPVASKKSKKAEHVSDPEAIRPTKRGRKKKQMLVILRYGSEDASKQSLMVARIQDIMSVPPHRTAATENNDLANVVASVAPLVLTAPAGPPKATHPFFLAKAMPSVESTKASRRFARETTAEQDVRDPSFFKSFITPGKLRSQAIQSRTWEGTEQTPPPSPRPVRSFRLPGTYEPAWPYLGFARIAPDAAFPCISPATFVLQSRKQKNKTQHISREEEILFPLSQSITAYRLENACNLSADRRLPERLVMTGLGLQARIAPELSGAFYGNKEGSLPHFSFAHPALSGLFNALPSSMSPYDRSQYDSQAWCQKYAPQSAAMVLQVGREVGALQAWLRSQTVAHVESGQTNVKASLKGSKTHEDEKVRSRRKRRKISNELDDFIISSDEEAMDLRNLEDEGEDLSQRSEGLPGSLIRDTGPDSSGRRANAVLLSGPHGCGKTATAYAVAKELGFEVFEIGPGSRRSGKDILDKVGDMTSNHQVRKAEKPSSDALSIDETLPTEPDANQSTLGSFFAKGKILKKSTAKVAPKIGSDLENRLQQASRQKQSLILLEEVDILFEEDKQFWETVLSLALQSKRPIILTCNDENVVPLSTLSLHAILRFQPAPEEIVQDYLLLIAATEGHLLTRKAVADLYRSRRCDLRGSISEINFWCQMAVGDEKGGMDWFLPRWPPGRDQDAHGRKLRVVSKHTFQPQMNVFNQDQHAAANSVRAVHQCAIGTELVNQTWTEWNVDPSSVSDYLLHGPLNLASDVGKDFSPHENWLCLTKYEKCLDSLTACDVLSRVDLPHSSLSCEVLDPTQPSLGAKILTNSTKDYPLLDACVRQDPQHLDTQIAIMMHLGVNRFYENTTYKKASLVNVFKSIAIEKITSLDSRFPTAAKSTTTRAAFSLAFDPISEPTPSSTPNSTASYPGLHASSFDGPFTLIVLDLAPYVRSIVAHDLTLAHHRQNIEEALSRGASRAKQVKMRTTRAARSALEGGRRATTRRERWFESKRLNLERVLRTGGENWPRGEDGLVKGKGSESGTADGTSRASSVDRVVG